MLTKRIIPCLDVHAGRVVKGINFVDIRDAGDPVEMAKAFNKAGADELVFLDITASADKRGIMSDVVAKTAEQVFIPLTVGGGIRTLEDFREMLQARRRQDISKFGGFEKSVAHIRSRGEVREPVRRMRHRC